MKQQYSELSSRYVRFQSEINVHIHSFVVFRKIFASLYVPFVWKFLEITQLFKKLLKKGQKLCCQPNILQLGFPFLKHDLKETLKYRSRNLKSSCYRDRSRYHRRKVIDRDGHGDETNVYY